MKKIINLFRIIALAAILAIFAIPARSQGNNIFDYKSTITPSVETFSMTKYDNHEHDLYTGAMQYTIPLYNYSDPDFQLPISLDYSFDGFKPGLNSGTVGYGWRLSCGGAITREVNGIPDETDWDDRGNLGYLYTIRDEAFDYDITNSSMSWPYMSGSYFQILYPSAYLSRQVPNMNLFSDMPMFYDYVESQPYTQRHYDSCPDMFHFSFNGIQGDFMLRRDGSFEVFNTNVPYGEIDIEWVVGQGIDFRPSRFVISTGDGYRYYFGMTTGDTSALKRTLEFSYTGTVWDEKSARDFMMGDDDEAWSEFMSEVTGNYSQSQSLRNSLYNTNENPNYNDWLYSYDPHGIVSAWKLVEIEAPNGRVLNLEYGKTYVDFSRELRYHPAMSYSTASGGTSVTSKKYQSLTSTFSCPLESVKVDGREVIRVAYSDREKDESNVSCFKLYPQYNPTGSNWDSFPLTEMGFVVGNPNDNNLVQQRIAGLSVYNDDDELVENISFSHFFTNDNGGSSKMFLSSVSSRNKGRFNLNYNVDSSFIFPLRDSQCVDHWGYWNGNSALESYDMRGLVDYSSLRTGGLYSQLTNQYRESNFNYAVKGALTSVVLPTGGSISVDYEPHTASRLIERDAAHLPYLINNDINIIPGGVRVAGTTDVHGMTTRTVQYDYRDGTLLVMPRYACSATCSIGSMGNYACVAFSKECDLSHLKDNHIAYSSVGRLNPDASVDEYCFVDYDSCPDDYGATSIITKYYLSEAYAIQSQYKNAFINMYAPPSGDNSRLRGRLRKEIHWSAQGGTKQSEVEYFYSYNAIGSACATMYTNMVMCYLQSEYVFRYPVLVDKTEKTYDVATGACVELATHRAFNAFGQETESRTSNVSTGLYRRTQTVYCHEAAANNQNFSRLRKLVSSKSEHAGDFSGGGLRSSYTYHYSQGNPNPVRIVETRGGSTRTTQVSYDNNYRPSRVDYPGGRWVQYSWSSDGRHLLASRSNDALNMTSYSWKDLVGLTCVNMPTGQSESYDYDGCNRLRERQDSDGNSTVTIQYHLENEALTQNAFEDQSIGGTNYIATRTHLNSSGSDGVTDVEYYDGLGYLVQKQSSHVNYFGGVLIQPVVYDDMLRSDAMSYLPYASSQNSLAYRPAAVSEQNSWYASKYHGEGNYAFAGTVYETGVNGRPVSMVKPGSIYHNGNHTTVTEYGLNDSDDNVRKIGFDSADFSILVDGYYPDRSINKITRTDEDGRTSIVFSDAFGRKVLSRNFEGQDGNGRVCDTYFVYDVRDSLVCVIQPEGVPYIDESIAMSSDEMSLDVDFLNKWCFTWEYDNWGNVLSSHVPGGGTSHYRYDSRDRLIYYYDSEMLSHGVCLHYVYDALDRLVREEYGTGSSDADFHVTAVTKQCSYYSPSSSNIPASAGLGFEANSIVASYDKRNDRCIQQISYEVLSQCPMAGACYLHPANTSVQRAYYYDGKGRLIQTVEKDSDGWFGRYSTRYDFVGNILATLESHRTPGGSEDVLLTEYTYDKRGRMTSSTVTFNGQRQHPVYYSYDELGRLDMKCFVDSNDDSVAYELRNYNLQGWQTETYLEYDGNNAFFQMLRYYNPVNNVPLYSGNISETEWENGEGSPRHRYAYTYDGLDRLSSTSHFVNGVETSSYCETGIRYDLNGNMTAMQRYHDDEEFYDDLDITYDGNRISYISGSESFDVDYDLNGRMTYDGQQGLVMLYNILNLPGVIRTDDQMQSADYSYLSDGTKYSVLRNDGVMRLYRGSFVYSGIYYESEDAVWDIFPESVATPEGRLNISEMGDIQDLLYAKDYQGNVRAILDLDAPDVESAVLERNDYMPFGTRIQNASHPQLESNHYRYAGKEDQPMSDNDLLDFGVRYYSPALSRWTTIDPKAEKYYSTTPYSYCAGNPVMYVDPDGAEPTPWEAILMAAYAYQDTNKKEYSEGLSSTGWEFNKEYSSATGLKAILFSREVDGTLEYTLAFAGTCSLQDVLSDISQLEGISMQYLEVAITALLESERLASNELTFVGHSLGGGEATLSSLITGRSAITFNPAALSYKTLFHYGKYLQKSSVTNYIATNNQGNPEILTTLQTFFRMNVVGNNCYIPVGEMPISRIHGIRNFYNAKKK